jgi:Rad3-related DNA helicase
MQKKGLKKQKKECSLSARKGRQNTRDFHKKKKTQENKETNQKLMRGEAKNAQNLHKTLQKKTQNACQTKQDDMRNHATPLSPQFLLTFFFLVVFPSCPTRMTIPTSFT